MIRSGDGTCTCSAAHFSRSEDRQACQSFGGCLKPSWPATHATRPILKRTIMVDSIPIIDVAPLLAAALATDVASSTSSVPRRPGKRARHSPVPEPECSAPDPAADPAVAAVAAQLDKACREVGFFMLTNHGIPQSLQDDLDKAAREVWKMCVLHTTMPCALCT